MCAYIQLHKNWKEKRSDRSNKQTFNYTKPKSEKHSKSNKPNWSGRSKASLAHNSRHTQTDRLCEANRSLWHDGSNAITTWCLVASSKCTLSPWKHPIAWVYVCVCMCVGDSKYFGLFSANFFFTFLNGFEVFERKKQSKKPFEISATFVCVFFSGNEFDWIDQSYWPSKETREGMRWVPPMR